MDSESSQPSSLLRNKQKRTRTRKIRMSCDACSSAKTKCDSTRPICVRCQKHQLECNYSVSQRKGKPPASSRDLSSAIPNRRLSNPAEERTANSPSLSSHHASVESAFCVDHDALNLDISLPMQEEETPVFWQQFTPDMSEYPSRELEIMMTHSNLFDQDLLFPANPSIAQPSLPQTNQITAFSNLEDEFLDSGTLNSPSTAEFRAPATQMPTPSSSNVSQASSRYDCPKLACSILNSLNLNSQPCSGSISTEASIASMDQILITNKSAVENTHQLLSCACCLSQKSFLMLSLIIDRILTHYQALIRPDTLAHRLSSPSPPASAEIRVRDTPITVGAYKMDAQDEQRMRMQLVSNELRKAAALVERYAERFYSLGCQEREETGIYTALTSFLRRRLKKAIDDTTSTLLHDS